MTGQDFQDKLDALVEDLQIRGKGQSIDIVFRGGDNKTTAMKLSSDAQGVVSATELADIQSFINPLKAIADVYAIEYEPVQTALEAFKTAQTPHEALIAAASLARKNLADALEADANYHAKKTALETARNAPAYIDAREDYVANNVSENFGNLGDAKGKYAS